MKYFLTSILVRPAAILIINAGVNGIAINITNLPKEISLKYGESIFIPLGSKHRMMNLSDKPVVFIEVQTGTYFGEDDIVRIEDIYDRK